jgi:hypothetical protein
MKVQRLFGLALAAAALAGCGTLVGEHGEEAEARRQVELARTLEAASNLREAAHEYSIVAQRYRNSSVWPAAVRKTALLYASPLNSSRNDSISLAWFNVYQALPLNPQEKDVVQSHVALQRRLKTLDDELGRQKEVNDSISVAAKKLTATVTAQGRRAQELEAQLHQTSEELKKLKAVDVRLSKSRRGR